MCKVFGVTGKGSAHTALKDEAAEATRCVWEALALMRRAGQIRVYTGPNYLNAVRPFVRAAYALRGLPFAPVPRVAVHSMLAMAMCDVMQNADVVNAVIALVPCAPEPVRGPRPHNTRSQSKPASSEAKSVDVEEDEEEGDADSVIAQRVVHWTKANAMGSLTVSVPVVGSQCYGVTPALGDGACFFHALVPALTAGDCRDLKHALWTHIEELHRAKDPGIQLAVGLDGTLTEYSRRYHTPAFHGGSVEAFAFTSWAKCELRVYHPAVENVATTNERINVTSSSHAREGSDVRFMVALVWNGGHYDTLYTSRVGEQRTATAREYRLPWGG